MQRPTINDPYLKVQLCTYSSSPDPIIAIWMHQHVCVDPEVNWTGVKKPSRAGMVNAILIELGRGHWDILTAGFAQIHFEGYPHPAAMQWRTHKGMGTLTQSLRYTGMQFMEDDVPLTQLFYTANKPSNHEEYFRDSLNAYRDLVYIGVKMEVARDLLPTCYRQGWSCAGNLKDWLHLLDRRLLADTQKEANHAAWAALDALSVWCPEIMNWYVEKRAGKNRLSP